MQYHEYWCDRVVCTALNTLIARKLIILQISGGGKAYISHYYSGVPTGDITNTFALYVSNITAETITVDVTFYDRDNSSGSAVVFTDTDDSTSTGVLRAYNVGSWYDESPASGSSVQFTVNAFETAYVLVRDTDTDPNYGYGIVEWSQNSDAIVGLLAYGRLFREDTNVGSGAFSAVPINGGVPF